MSLFTFQIEGEIMNDKITFKKLVNCGLVAIIYLPISYVVDTLLLQKGFDYTWTSTKELMRDC